MPGAVAAAKVAGKSAGRGSTAAGSSAASKTGLPRDPGRHASKLRGQGMGDDQIRTALRDMGYDDATTKNVVPGVAKPKTRPAPTQTVDDLETPEPAAAAPADPVDDDPSPAAARRVGRADPGSSGIAGFLLGLVGTAVLINFMREGPAGVSRWAQAKFLNRGTPAPATPGSSGKSGLPGAGAPVPGAPRYPLVPLPAPGAGAGGGGGRSW